MLFYIYAIYLTIKWYSSVNSEILQLAVFSQSIARVILWFIQKL